VKILAVAEFDCAGVLTGHRRALRALGVDYCLAIRDVYNMPVQPDWIVADPTGEIPAGLSLVDVQRENRRVRDELLSFAEEADVIQFHPAIGQHWSYTTLEPRLDDGEDEKLFGIDWRKINPRAHRVSLFHGSRNAEANAALYALYWMKKNHRVWATTLDYTFRMGAAYAPPAVDLRQTASITVGEQATLQARRLIEFTAPLRGDDDPLIAVQAPSDPDNCHTGIFLDACRRSGAVADLVVKRPHAEVVQRKLRAHAGFDHLRGSFSVNTIENLALGLAPLVALRQEYWEILDREIGHPGEAHPFATPGFLFPFEDEEGFRKDLAKLARDPALTRHRQYLARAWYERSWRPEIIGAKLKKMYEAL
jgi:hypothetical protein